MEPLRFCELTSRADAAKCAPGKGAVRVITESEVDHDPMNSEKASGELEGA